MRSLLAQLDGSYVSGSFESSGSAMTLVFTTDGSVTMSGFTAYFTTPFENPDLESSISPVNASMTYDVVKVPVGASAPLIVAEMDCYCCCYCSIR